ncbi:DUF2399 domain-containing protein [uncultured Ilyobacter sp.]|uniref:DUF2399 domain-containing protein n=1 Tax=uncultured Ilyobacter sp. TaxID=544433 RepID=UPI0029F53F9D|nr:DUF2399 domain-containing protein [uncultured Ilyobacter sp.]
MLIDFFNSEGMKRVVKELEKKYYSYGDIKGTINIEFPTPVEIDTLKKLGIKTTGETIKFTVKKLLENLDMKDPKELENILSNELGINLKTKKDILEKESNKINKKINTLIESINSKKLREYILRTSLILKLDHYHELVKILDTLEENPKRLITLGNLGGRSVNNPHFFDVGTSNYRYLINYLKHYFNEDVKNSMDEKALLLKMGIVGDSLSNFITVYGFRGVTKDNTVYTLLENDENININIGNLYKIKSIEAKYSKVLIVENPNVFIAIKEYLETAKERISLICTSGQINQCGYLFLDKLEKQKKEVYYSGDIDPEGILIGQGLKEKCPWITLVSYSKENLIKYMSEVKLTKERLKKLEKVKLGDEIKIELLDTLVKEERGAYQEAYYREIVNEIFK